GATVAGFRSAVAADLTRDIIAPAARAALSAALRSAAVPAAAATGANARAKYVALLMKSSAGRAAAVQGLFGRFQGARADGRLGSLASEVAKVLGYDRVVAGLLGSAAYAR
ncbi:MAG: hypothetical protein ACRC33_27840, partial [Gemmataceae bacterium]